jgi:CO/xanthine dehydrogenase FAD-binding subunit
VRIDRPRTLEELHLHVESGAQLMGGGTLLVPGWRRRPPSQVVVLDRIEVAGSVESCYLGAAAAIAALDVGLVPHSLRMAANRIGTAPVRAQATVGGNLLGSGPRCLLAPLVSLQARARVLGGAGGLIVDMPLADAMRERRVLVGLQWRTPSHSAYRRLQRRRVGPPDFAVAGAVLKRHRATSLTVAVWSAGVVESATVPFGDQRSVSAALGQLGTGFREEMWQRNQIGSIIRLLETKAG